MRDQTRRFALAGIAAACGAALLTGCTPYNNEMLRVPAQTLGPVPCAPTGTSPKPSTIEAATAGPYLVESVVDGDTIRIDCNGESTRVRLVGINTPETVKEDAPAECGGPEASASLHAILDSGEVFLSTDPVQSERDRYGRLLAYAWALSGSLVNRTMIELGHAEATGCGKDYAYKEPFEAAAQTARTAGTGRWACPR